MAELSRCLLISVTSPFVWFVSSWRSRLMVTFTGCRRRETKSERLIFSGTIMVAPFRDCLQTSPHEFDAARVPCGDDRTRSRRVPACRGWDRVRGGGGRGGAGEWVYPPPPPL